MVVRAVPNDASPLIPPGLGDEELGAGGPWAVRYSLSHLVKDEHTLGAEDWRRTAHILPHGPLAAGYLTGRFDCTSASDPGAGANVRRRMPSRWMFCTSG